MFYGGRGAGKSWSFAFALLIIGAKQKTRILCTREIQGSIRQSVHHLLSSCIDELELNTFYRITRDTITGANGTEFIFHGLRHDPMQIKSLEGVDICWVEEAQKTTNESWDILIPTIRKKGSEIWVSFNPNLDSDPTFQKFVVNPRDGILLKKVNYYDNPFFTKELQDEVDYLKSTDYGEYSHIWEGECKTFSSSQIFRNKYKISSFKTPEDITPYLGLDWGFSQDPTVIIRCFVIGDELYIDQEAGGTQVELDHTHKLIDAIPNSKQYTIRADSARPESISFVKRQGYRIESVHKWPGSIEDGIEFVRSFRQINIHERCIEVASEFMKYSYKVDKLTGDILPDIVDKDNHYIDALRYALQPMIKKRGKPKLARVTGI